MNAVPKSEEIMDLAECLARTSGYNGFSFRDLAEAAKVKSASIHYYFPTKEDLALAIARRYADRVFARLGDAGDLSVAPDAKMDVFIETLRNAVTADGRVCLFLVFGGELLLLPESVQLQVRMFFERTIDWLSVLLARYDAFAQGSGRDTGAAARAIIAALDGAMVGARVATDPGIYDIVVGELRRSGLIPTTEQAPRP